MKNDNIQVLSTFYNDLSLLRASILAIPIVGNYIDLTLSMPGQKYVEERLEYLINELHQEMDEVKEAITDNTFFKSEEGFDLITKTFSAAAKTRQRNKLKLFAKILRGAYTCKTTTHDPEIYVKIVDELSEIELNILFILYEVRTDLALNPSNSRFQGDMVSDAERLSSFYPQFSKESLEFILPRIEKTGLIKEITGSYMGLVGGNYNPTPICSLFISFIQNNE